MKCLQHHFPENSCRRIISPPSELHFTSNETGYKINSIRPAYDHLFTEFREMFRPGSRVNVDESQALERIIGLEAIHQKKSRQIWHKSFDLCEYTKAL